MWCLDSFIVCLCFFFFKLSTAFDMRISDCSSDVCSSDLHLDNSLLPSRESRAQSSSPLKRQRRGLCGGLPASSAPPVRKSHKSRLQFGIDTYSLTINETISLI